jgi:hypothetical protein
MLAHRKRELTPLSGHETAPSVGLPAFLRRRERLTMHHIDGASSPSRKVDKTISVAPYCLNML